MQENNPHLEVLAKISDQDFQLALELSNNENFLLKTVDGFGKVIGQLNGDLHLAAFTEDGYIWGDPKNSIKSISLALYCLSLLAQKRLAGKLKKIFVGAPAWLNKNFSPTLQIVENANGKPLEFTSVEDLQSYWALKEVASFSKNKIPAELLAKHVLKIYRPDTWEIQLAAMETLVNRIKSAQDEELSIARRPPLGKVMGFYKINRKSEGVLGYEVLLASNQGLSVSCSCKDYQKNTLQFCKHSVAVFEYWFANEKRIRKFNKRVDEENVHVRWNSDPGTKQIWHPLDGISLSRKMALNINKFFNDDLKFKHNYKSVSEKIIIYKKFKKCLETNRSKIWIDPVIFPLIDREIEKLNWPLVFEKKKARLFSIFKELNIKLYPYQVSGVKRALENGKLLLGDDMGLGKTIQAITWAECLLRTNTAKKIIVITPSALKDQWKREWSLVSGRSISVVDGSLEDRQSVYLSKASVLIVNYELLLRDLEIIKNLNANAIILDEAQRIKNYSSQTSRCVKQLHPQFKLILTGTPMENRISELASLMDWVDDHVLAPSWRLDSELNINKNGHEHGPKGVKGLNLLREKINPHFLRRTRQQVLTDLPSRSDSLRLIPFTDEQKNIHDDFGSKVARLMAIAGTRPLRPEEHLRLMAYLTHMRIVSNAFAQYDYDNIWESLKKDKRPEKRITQLSSPKLAEFRNLIEGLLSQENVKIVIFSQWQRMLRLCHWAIHDILKDEGIEAVFFTGREKQSMRNNNIIRFHDDPSVRIFFASDAGGVGLNLQKAATVCINLELPWNPAVLEQRIARIHRLGQKRPIQVYNLVTQGSIEERITNLVGQKKAVFNTLFDGSSDEVIFEENSSFYSQVKEVIQLPVENKKIIDSEKFEEDCDEGLDLALKEEELTHDQVENELLEQAEQTEHRNDNQLLTAFNNIKIERKSDGTIKIEASQESAEVLAMVFKNMSKMFADAATV